MEYDHRASIFDQISNSANAGNFLHSSDDPQEREEQSAVFSNQPKDATAGACKCEILTRRSPDYKPPGFRRQKVGFFENFASGFQ